MFLLSRNDEMQNTAFSLKMRSGRASLLPGQQLCHDRVRFGWRIIGRGWWQDPSAGRGALAGLAYGLLLWLGANYVVLPATRSPMGEIPAIHLLIAHVLYGAALGLALTWVARRGA